MRDCLNRTLGDILAELGALREENDIQRASIQSLSRQLAESQAEPKPDPKQQAYIEVMEPVFLMVADMTRAWDSHFDRLIMPIQELIRTYKRAEKEAEKHQIQIPSIHHTLPSTHDHNGDNATPDRDTTNPVPTTAD